MQTSNIDGETNLKERDALDYTQKLLNSLSPQERQRIRNVDELLIKELNKQNNVIRFNKEDRKQRWKP